MTDSLADINRRTAEPAVGQGASPSGDAALLQANDAVSRLAAEYPAHAARDIADLEMHMRRMAGDRDNRRDHYNEILRIAHDISGQGTLFGYPMLTRYAMSLCRATRLLEHDDRDIMPIVRAHIMALRAVLDCRAKASDRTARTIAAGLEIMVSIRIGR